ncbi:MAG: hypothetical protein L3J97_04430, partial [Thermoplasmata archaeon]|nr:hypothetical protein [Thermoplasmata archaeon]
MTRATGAGVAALLALLPSGLLVAGATGTTTIPVSITSSANPADAGLPFVLTAHFPSPSSWYYLNWTDSLGGSNTAPTWELDIAVPGPLTVRLRVSEPWGDQGVVNLTVGIRPPPSVTVSSPLSQVDAGVPAPLFIGVAGGMPPFTTSWTPSGGGATGSAAWSSDGNYSVAVSFETPGPGWVLVRAVDALGDPASVARLVTEVVPAGVLQLTTNGTVGEVGRSLGLVVVLEEGAPPFRWSFSSTLPAIEPEGPFGTFPSDGVYAWSVQFAAPGSSYLNLTVVDALGAVATAATLVSVVPPLFVNVTSLGDREPATPFDFGATVSGGLPPYAYQFRLSDGEGVQGVLAAPGVLEGTFNPRTGGNYSVEVRVSDALGQTWISTRLLHVDGAPTPTRTASPSDLSVYGGILAISVAALFAGLSLYQRFRAGSTSTAPPTRSALPTVRQLMKRSLTIDRETLLLLGEEAGESAEGVQSALETLIRAGEVTTEPGPTDDEVLHW